MVAIDDVDFCRRGSRWCEGATVSAAPTDTLSSTSASPKDPRHRHRRPPEKAREPLPHVGHPVPHLGAPHALQVLPPPRPLLALFTPAAAGLLRERRKVARAADLGQLAHPRPVHPGHHRVLLGAQARDGRGRVRVEGAQGPPPQGQARVRDDVELRQPQHPGQERRVDEQRAEHEEGGPEDDLSPDADLRRGDRAGAGLVSEWW